MFRLENFAFFLSTIVISSGSLDLQCSSKDCSIGDPAEDSYITLCCDVDSLVINSPNETITSVNGDTFATNFEILLITSSEVEYLPKGIGEFFPQLITLEVHSGVLKSIKSADLEGLSSLSRLSITNNLIKELKSDLFEFTPGLNDINFKNNQISHIGRNLFKKVDGNYYTYIEVDLSRNECIDLRTTTEDRVADFNCKVLSHCPEPIDLISVKEKYFSEDFESYENEIRQLKADIERLKRTWYNGLLDATTKLLQKESAKLKNCMKAEIVEEKLKTGAEVILKLVNVSENSTVLEMNVESPGSKVAKIVDVSSKEVQPTQTEITVDQQSVLFLPVNLGQIFPSLLQLSVTFSGLYALDTRSFIGMYNVVAINFTGNKILEISEDAFVELESLKELDLSHNNIETIHDEAFEENVELETLRLNHNQLAAISSPSFKPLKKLRLLFLNDNKLKLISDELPSISEAFEVVDLRNNDCIDLSFPESNLKEIESEILHKCVAPVELKCSRENLSDETHCQVTNLILIHPGSILTTKNLANAEKIKVLSIVDQKTLFIPSKIFEKLPKLVQLVVEHSQLQILAKSDFKGMTSLKEIRIERNNISTIEEGIFNEVPQLVHLNLAQNHIASLPSRAFAILTNLKSLVLNGNFLVKFSANMLPRRNIIKDFQLQDNTLEFVENKILRLLRNADLIDLSNNTCVDMKYERSDTKSSSVKEISAHIETECAKDME